MRSYLGITGHFISESWFLESVMLGCNRVTGRHTADNITLWYDEITSNFGISDKVKDIFTDSASNVKKAFLTLPGFENDVEQRSDSEDQIDDVNDNDDDNEEILEAQSISSEDMPLKYCSCFAHTLQLVVKDGLKKAGQINTVINRCSNLVSFKQKSTVATITHNGEKSPQNDNVTRWSSQLKMMKSVFSIPESKLSEIDGAAKLLAYDQNVLRDIVEILTPLVKATDSVQVDCVPSAGYAMRKGFVPLFKRNGLQISFCIC